MPRSTFDSCFARTAELMVESGRVLETMHDGVTSISAQVTSSRKSVGAANEAIHKATAQLGRIDGDRGAARAIDERRTAIRTRVAR